MRRRLVPHWCWQGCSLRPPQDTRVTYCVCVSVQHYLLLLYIIVKLCTCMLSSPSLPPEAFSCVLGGSQ